MPVVHGTRTTRKIKPLQKGYMYSEKQLALSQEITIERDGNVARFKVGHGSLNGKWEDYLIPNKEGRTRGTHDFIVPKGHKDTFRFSFFPRTIAEWNKLCYQSISLYL